MEKLEKLASLQNQGKVVRLQDKHGKQKFHEDMKKVFEPVTKSLENTSEKLTKNITETSFINNKALENLKNKLLEIMMDGGILETYLLSLLSKITNPEKSSHYELVKYSSSKIVNDLLIHSTIPITFYNILLIFLDTGRELELKGDLLKMITNENYNVDLASLADNKLLYDFAKAMSFDVKATGNKPTRYRTLIRILKSTGLMVSACGISGTIFLSSDPNGLCDRLRLLLQDKEGGNKSEIINEEIVAIVDKLLE